MGPRDDALPVPVTMPRGSPCRCSAGPRADAGLRAALERAQLGNGADYLLPDDKLQIPVQ